VPGTSVIKCRTALQRHTHRVHQGYIRY